MIPSSRYYRESIFIHYSYVTFYAYSFPHNNIHTYIMYILRVSISMCMCSYDSILLYSYTQYSREILLLLSNFELLLSIHLNCYCLHIELLLSNRYCLTWNYYYLYIELLLSNCYCLHIELLLSNFELLLSRHLNCYFLTLNCYCPTVTVLTLNCYCPTSPYIFIYFQSYRTLFQARLVSLES